MPVLGTQLDAAELDSALLSALIDATTAREGAASVLHAVAAAFEESEVQSLAIAARDRDGVSLNVLAERGAPHAWPETLEPRFALGGQAGVDAATDAFVVPLRANGRVVGALLAGGSVAVTSQLRDPAAARMLDSVAATLDALIARAEAAVQRRAAALRSVESVLDGMAHQMANPMTGASAIAQLLAEELVDDGQRAAVKQINQELSRAFAVLKDLLDFQHASGAHAGVLDLNTIVEDITRLRGYAIREQGIALQVDLVATPLPVRIDASRIEHALLIALRFAELQSRGSVNRAVAVQVAERANGDVSIEITDSGPGNAPNLAHASYDLAFEGRAHGGTPEALDLGLVGSLLRGAGGRLEVHASKATGTTLSLVLPLAAGGRRTPIR